MNEKKIITEETGKLDRRTFLQGVVAASSLTALPAAGVFGAVERVTRVSPNEKVNIAVIGVGNRGWDVLRGLNDTGLVNVVALCDTEIGDTRTLNAIKLFPNVPQFKDFRQLFDKMGKQFDAVAVATPDHSHFPVCMLAMNQHKHVYVEKPLAHSFYQIELMMAAERRYKVACQMGNQGHSEANYHQFKAWVNAGIIKNVSKITAFMNSPRRWHGMVVNEMPPAQRIPSYLDWSTWIATANDHRFNGTFLNGDWRSWFDFGNGALGDWGAHIFDTCHEFLQLGLPTVVEPTLDGHSDFIFPQASTIAFHFPKRKNMPACDLTWYDGVKNLPPLPAGFSGGVVDPNIPPPTKGTIDTKVAPPGKVIYGEGLTFKGGSHASTLEVINKEAAKDMKFPEVPVTTSNHFLNFVRACRGEEKTRSHFGVAGPLCQAMAIGIIAQRVNAKLEFDPKKRKITNHKIADALLKGVPPRKDWEQFYKM